MSKNEGGVNPGRIYSGLERQYSYDFFGQTILTHDILG